MSVITQGSRYQALKLAVGCGVVIGRATALQRLDPTAEPIAEAVEHVLDTAAKLERIWQDDVAAQVVREALPPLSDPASAPGAAPSATGAAAREQERHDGEPGS